MTAILITGANRGLGFEFASRYAADGWRVFAACRNPAAANELQCLAQNSKNMLSIVALDVTDGESVRTAARQLKDVAIDVLINSAGITGASGQTTGNVDYDSWAHVFDVNTMRDKQPHLARAPAAHSEISRTARSHDRSSEDRPDATASRPLLMAFSCACWRVVALWNSARQRLQF